MSAALVEQFLERLRSERRYAAPTLLAYARDLRGLVEELNPKAWSSITSAQIRRLVAQRAALGLAARSIARTLSAWRGFFDFLLEYQLVSHNPVRQVRAPKMPHRLPKALPADDSQRLLDHTDAQSSATWVRDQAIMELFYGSGLRLSELIQLDMAYHAGAVGWYERSEALVHVLGKGSRRRSLPVGAKAVEAIDAWLNQRAQWIAKLGSADAHALFLGVRGARISPRSIQHRLAEIGKARGLPVRLHPHALRHSFASDLLQSSGDLRAVQELLGHASIASTQIYTSLDFQRLAEVYDKAHPRAGRRSSG
ncbi:MAG: tyrosine recombinase XerC [Betaproteobacteria bacterium]